MCRVRRGEEIHRDAGGPGDEQEVRPSIFSGGAKRTSEKVGYEEGKGKAGEHGRVGEHGAGGELALLGDAVCYEAQRGDLVGFGGGNGGR